MSDDRPPIDRRRLLAGAAAAGLALTPAAALAQRKGLAVQEAARGVVPGKGLTFFTAREHALLDEIAEMIIPADARSGGARAAKVADHLDRLIGESLDGEWRQSWRDDLAEIDRLSRAASGKGFLEATAEQRTRLLQRISRNEANPKEAGEYAFGTIKWSVADIFYRTRIGIHDELDYRGNVIQDAFAGFDANKK